MGAAAGRHERRPEPHLRDEGLGLRLGQPATEALPGEHVLKLRQQLGACDQLEAFLRPGVQQRRGDASRRDARRDQDVWVKDDAHAHRPRVAHDDGRGPR